MRTTIDKSGRVVVPREARRLLGLVGGEALDVTVADGRIEFSVAASDMHLEERDGVLVAVPEAPLPELTSAEVRAAIESQRR